MGEQLGLFGGVTLRREQVGELLGAVDNVSKFLGVVELLENAGWSASEGWIEEQIHYRRASGRCAKCVGAGVEHLARTVRDDYHDSPPQRLLKLLIATSLEQRTVPHVSPTLAESLAGADVPPEKLAELLNLAMRVRAECGRAAMAPEEHFYRDADVTGLWLRCVAPEVFPDVADRIRWFAEVAKTFENAWHLGLDIEAVTDEVLEWTCQDSGEATCQALVDCEVSLLEVLEGDRLQERLLDARETLGLTVEDGDTDK